MHLLPSLEPLLSNTLSNVTMAEVSALTSIAKSALQLFTSLAKDEFLLLWHSGEDLQKLRDTIDTISGFLVDAEERQSTDLSVQSCLSKLRKVMYDADDFFDALAFHLLRKKTSAGNAFMTEVQLFFSKSNNLGFIVQTAHKVKSLRKSVDAVAKNMQQFSFIQQPFVDQSFPRKKTHSSVRGEDIIGRDQDKVRVIDMLIPPKDKGESSSAESFSVVAVIGFGGLGKTTLAQLVYNDEKVKQGFEVHLWACINYLSDLELVLKEILASKVEKTHLDLSLEMLQEKLRGIIDKNKFLIVLDDVWDDNSAHWRDLETVLSCGKSGSKVLVTTRSREVAKCLNASEPYYDLRGLSEESAWSLFVKRAFQGEELSEHPELEPIGKKILSKCGNVPLAIVTVGSLLHRKNKDGRTWRNFYDKLKQVLVGDDSNSIKPVLMVSYNDLHPNLKLCFATCSLLPKDYKFDKDELVRLWLAQGILKPCDENIQSLEEVGESYFFDLVDRCFFQEVQYQFAGARKCEYVGNNGDKCIAKMHDLLHDMAIEVAKTENMLLNDAPVEKKGETDGLRHISIDFVLQDSFNCCSLVSDPKAVRTILLSRRNMQFSETSFKQLVASFRGLRTLHLSSLRIDVIPELIGGLIHLRYLNLSGNKRLECLPDSICELHHLMILVLEGCALLEKLPPRIEKLASLRQLFIDGCDRLDCLPLGLERLTRLVNLDRLIVHRSDGGLRYLKGLDNLAGTLKIELPDEGWIEAVEDAKKSNMAQKKKLNEMHMAWKQSSAVTAKMGKEEAKAVLEALQPHENLEYLRIFNYGGEILSSWCWRITYVKQMYLYKCDNVEYLDDGIKGDLDLPSLKLLSIEEMRNLKGWWRPEIAQGTDRPHLSSVSSLYIKDCPKLKGQMPLFERIEYLKLTGVDAELLKELLVPNGFCESSFSPFYKNNRLKELHLLGIKGLFELPEGCIRHLTTLEILNIQCCSSLRRVSRRGLAHLTALKKLEIGSGEIGDEGEIEDDKIRIREAGMPWKTLQGLVFLNVEVGDKHLLEGLEYLTSLEDLIVLKWKDVARLEVELPFKALQNLRKLLVGFNQETFDLVKSGIQHLHSLWSLTIWDCKELYLGWKTLFSMKLGRLEFVSVERVIDVEDDTVMEPHCLLQNLVIWHSEWMDDIPWKFLSSSLKRLLLGGTGERENLPDGIQLLSSLQTLEIYDCSAELKRRCKRGTGDDWRLISHIPSTTISSINDDFMKVRAVPPVWIPKRTSLITHLSIGKCSAEPERKGGSSPFIREDLPGIRIGRPPSTSTNSPRSHSHTLPLGNAQRSLPFNIREAENLPGIRILPPPSTSTNEDRFPTQQRDQVEEEEEGSRKMGGCGGLSLSPNSSTDSTNN